jgi:hypothetical protein
MSERVVWSRQPCDDQCECVCHKWHPGQWRACRGRLTAEDAR